MNSAPKHNGTEPGSAASTTFLNTAEIAAKYKVSRAAVSRWIKGVKVGDQVVRLAVVVHGGRTRASLESLEQFEQACTAARYGPTRTEDQEAAKVETPTQFRRRAKREKELAAKALSGRR